MERVLQVATPADSQRQVRLRGFPDECPRCHTKIVPKPLAQVTIGPDQTHDVEEAFHCTNAKCGRVFVATYGWAPGSTTPPSYNFVRSAPIEPIKPMVSDLVTALSPTFFETYSQAIVAESLGLSQLTGIGLRKALEFLVKDFAILKNPTSKDEIAKKPLAACIKEHLTDPQVREVAKRATWLGNDETHYVRRWEDKDINDLKVLIRLTVNGIENILLADKYITDMPEA